MCIASGDNLHLGSTILNNEKMVNTSPLTGDGRGSDTADPLHFLGSRRLDCDLGLHEQIRNATPSLTGNSISKDELGYVPISGLQLSFIRDLGGSFPPKVSLTQAGSDTTSFSEDLHCFGCHSPAISPSSSSTSTLFSPEQPISLSEAKSLDSPRSPASDSILVGEHDPKSQQPHALDVMPTACARTYSPRFPVGHTLCSDFLQKYTLDGELGSGGYGFVMAARHRLDNVEVAVKFITKDRIPAHAWSFDDAGNEVPLEAKLLAMVSHHGIVKFFDLYDDDVYFYLVRVIHSSVKLDYTSDWVITGARTSRFPLAQKA